MTRTLSIVIAVFALALGASAQEPVKVSADFSKAANLALVAIKNSPNAGLGGPDKLVREAINSAEAAAFTAPEIAVVKRLKALSIKLPLLNMLDTGKPNSPAREDLSKIDGCIAATRLALRDLSGDEPKECKAETK
jgi:hypothetical protein